MPTMSRLPPMVEPLSDRRPKLDRRDFALPFVLFMPVYGRLGDGLGARRLLLAGIALLRWAPRSWANASTMPTYSSDAQ